MALDRTGREHPAVRHVATFGMAVAADRRGRGIGAALLAEGLRWARGVGVEKAELSVFPGKPRGAGLVPAFGFVDEGRLFDTRRSPTGSRTRY